MWFVRLATCGICLLTVSAAVASDLPIRVYSTADGLRNNSVNRIVTDSHGFLWFCTSDGVSRFDGYRFQNFSVADGLTHRRVNDVLESRSGDFWFATGGGLCRLRVRSSAAPSFETIKLPTASRWVTRLLEPRSSTSAWPAIWCGTASGLFRFTPRDNQFQPVELGRTAAEARAFIHDVYEDAGGTIWVGTEQGLYRYREGMDPVRYTVDQGLPANQVTSVTQDSRGAIWAATWRGATRITQRGAEGLLNRRSGLAADYLYALLSLKNGDLLLAGTGGLTVTDSERTVQRRIGGADGLVVSDTEALAEDSNGNIWAGTDGGGAAKIAQSGLTTFSEKHGIEGRPSAILESQAGELVLLTKTDDVLRLYRREGERFRLARALSSAKNFGWGTGQVAFQAARSEWWIASGAGLYRFGPSPGVAGLAGKKFSMIVPRPAGSPGPLKCFEDSRGDVWMAFRTLGGLGLARWNRSSGAMEQIPPDRDAARPSSFPFVFAEDSFGAVWVGYFQGKLMRYRQGHLRPIGLPPSAANGIRSLLVDSKGRLWVGTSEAGLLRIDKPDAEEPAPVAYAGQENFANDFIQCLAEDTFGRIYACTGRGVVAFDPVSSRIRRYTAEDGLVKGDLVLGLRDREGGLWFGSAQGVSRLIPRADAPASGPYIQISRVEVRGVPQSLSPLGQNIVRGMRVPFGAAPVRIEITGVTFRPGEVLRYQTKLEDADLEWSTPSQERTTSYVALQPGSYRFLARALNAEGLASANPAEVDFTILAPFWRRWWFFSLVCVTLTGAGVSLHRVRLARLMELERVRNRIATDLHDDIGSTLSQISILSEVARQQAGDRADAPIGRISELSREVLESMADIVWAINPARDRSSDLIHRMRHFAAELFTAAEVELDFDVDPSVTDCYFDPELRRELLLVFKEAANNAVKHACASRVRVRVWGGREVFGFSISDDGRGFEPAKVSGEGNGLPGMARRLRTRGGTAEVISRPGGGTTVRVEISVRPQRRPTQIRS